MSLSFYKGKKVLITGHTGFKGAWLCQILHNAGAEVVGYSLLPNTEPNLYTIAKIEDFVKSYIGDIRDYDNLKKVFDMEKPEIVFHLAAQPIVKESYENPVYTYETNVMGTVNVCECIRLTPSVKSFVNITTDKVYKNNEWEWGYRENEYLDGYDPYSNSKSCSELVTHSYNNSFFKDKGISVSTARAGNVIGGGDFSRDRIIPDCVRAAYQKRNIIVRNYTSVRPYQHVLEPLSAYLLIAEKQYHDIQYASCYNVGPNDMDCVQTGTLVAEFCNAWGEDLKWEKRTVEGPHEANFLKLDCSKIKKELSWFPKWNIKKAVDKTVEWYKAYKIEEDIRILMNKQIDEYFNNGGK